MYKPSINIFLLNFFTRVFMREALKCMDPYDWRYIQDKETSFKRVILLKNVKILLEWFWNSHLYGIYIKIKNWIEKTSSGFCSIKTNGLEENNFCISYYIFMVLKNI